jgi:aspartate kinase
MHPRSDYLDRHKLAIVCSARSGSTKALGTTNLLFRAASEALRRPPPSALSPVQSGTATPLTDSLIFRRSRTCSPPETLSSFPELCTGSFSKTVDMILSEHITAARDCVKEKTLLAELEAEMARDCENLRAFLSATQVRVEGPLHAKQALRFGQVIDEISPRSKDSIVGFGEKLSCKIITAVLRDHVRSLRSSSTHPLPKIVDAGHRRRVCIIRKCCATS